MRVLIKFMEGIREYHPHKATVYERCTAHDLIGTGYTAHSLAEAKRIILRSAKVYPRGRYT